MLHLRDAGRSVVSATTGVATDAALRLAPRTCVRLFGFLESRRAQSSLALLSSLLRTGDIVVDAGAHRGVYTERAAHLVGPSGHVHAFEPNPDSWRVLDAVIADRPNITLHRVGLSDQPGSATLFRPRPKGRRVDAMSSLSRPGARSSIDHDPVGVSLSQLDTILAADADRIDLIKIDVEGHEAAVLRGSIETLRRSRPKILVEIEQRHQRADIRETFGYLEQLGYRGSFIAPDGLRPISEFDTQRHQSDLLPESFAIGRPAPGYISDFLFVPDGPDRSAQ